MSLKLKYLILAVAMLSILLTFFSSTLSGYRMNKEHLIEVQLRLTGFMLKNYPIRRICFSR